MIDYRLLNDSILYYEKHGFKRIEAPWTVTKQIADITKPEFVSAHSQFELKHIDNKMLVASGEQSFLYLYNKGFLPKGRYQTITPCFREDSFDETHTKYFMKNELIDTENVDNKTLVKMVHDAFDFYKGILCQVSNKDFDLKSIIMDDNTYDIELNGIEIGSYGIRKCSFLKWIYGTGISEPRFSRILETLK